MTPRETAVLEFEAGRQWPQGSGRKAERIRDVFGVSEIRYTQILNHLIGDPAAHALAPQLVARLLRIRDAARARRRGDTTPTGTLPPGPLRPGQRQ